MNSQHFGIRLKIMIAISIVIATEMLLLYYTTAAVVSHALSQASINSETILHVISRVEQTHLWFIAASCVVSILCIAYCLKLLFSPFNYLSDTLLLIEKGVLPTEIKFASNDEIGNIAKRLNTIVQNLKSNANFAAQIGQGKFDNNFKAISEDDLLGHSLVDMSIALQSAELKEKQQNWVVTGVAALGDILRNHTQLDLLSDEVLKYMIGYINATQGAFYIVNEGDEYKRSTIEMIATYAYNRKKYLQKTFEIGEGLVGQAVAEHNYILRTEIPADYQSISSGLLGDKKPSCLYIYPLINNDTIYGALEFAGLETFTSDQLRFIEEVSPIIARTIFNIQVNIRTQQHLQQSQAMSAELTQQQEELRQNAEEMQATQEELKSSNIKLEEQVKEVSNTQKRMHSLLENASEVITIYNKDSSIKYVSPSVNRILGYNATELTGTKEDGHIHEENLSSFQEVFRKLLVHANESFTLQYQYLKRNGDWIWLEATGKNLLDDPAVMGIVFNARDITLKRKAEIEERMRKNMQALSENSPDLITRISAEGNIAYTNPSIETYTGNKPFDFINQSIETLNIGTGIMASWSQILEEIKQTETKIKKEVTYQAPMGDRIMQVNAIPEFNNDDMESVLIVSHDITERKQIELEIQSKNKSINESINYSKRIQNAIIPDTKLIQSTFGESFIMYLPRDVVSGDFPWFVRKGDDAYIAAVDCTGHGVPGAMLSLVGYFQLNNIVDAFPNENPAFILDHLDEKVNQTLIKENSEEAIKDGMDIAFCKINTKTSAVEFAGAHRQLLHLSGGEITEYKGNKWAIGGGTYKNQTYFTNHSIKVKKGDSIYFYSDGLPDQFGGPDNRKFGNVRIKQIITENAGNTMEETYVKFNSEFSKWKEGIKQTDDVLLIGIKF